MPGSEVQQSHLTSAMAKGIPFTFKTGGVRYKCQLQDRTALYVPFYCFTLTRQNADFFPVSV